MAFQSTLINGSRFSWTSISIMLNGVENPIGPFKSINYSIEQEAGLVYGTLSAPIGKTRGKQKVSVSFEMLRAEWQSFATALYAVILPINPTASVLDADFTIIVSYTENSVDVVSDQIFGCRVTKFDLANSEGSTDAATVKVDAVAMQLVLNGVITAGAVAAGLGSQSIV